MSFRRSMCALALIAAIGACASKGHELATVAPAGPTDAAITNLNSVLQARAPGATIRADARPMPLVERRSSLKPLYIVDGVRLTLDEAQAMDLDPAHIVELYILKPAEAVRTYGDRARDGAVLITTRRL